MLRPTTKRSIHVFALAVTAFAGGTLCAAGILPREAHADLSTSSIRVPAEGLTFRSPDGRAIARLSYDARGGMFEVLGDHGDAVAAMGQRGGGTLSPSTPPKTSWSLDDVRDPWRESAPKEISRPSSGL